MAYGTGNMEPTFGNDPHRIPYPGYGAIRITKLPCLGLIYHWRRNALRRIIALLFTLVARRVYNDN